MGAYQAHIDIIYIMCAIRTSRFQVIKYFIILTFARSFISQEGIATFDLLWSEGIPVSFS